MPQLCWPCLSLAFSWIALWAVCKLWVNKEHWEFWKVWRSLLNCLKVCIAIFWLSNTEVWREGGEIYSSRCFLAGTPVLSSGFLERTGKQRGVQSRFFDLFFDFWEPLVRGPCTPHLPASSFFQKERITPTLRNTDCLISPTKALNHWFFTFLQHVVSYLGRKTPLVTMKWSKLWSLAFLTPHAPSSLPYPWILSKGSLHVFGISMSPTLQILTW